MSEGAGGARVTPVVTELSPARDGPGASGALLALQMFIAPCRCLSRPVQLRRLFAQEEGEVLQPRADPSPAGAGSPRVLAWPLPGAPCRSCGLCRGATEALPSLPSLPRRGLGVNTALIRPGSPARKAPEHELRDNYTLKDLP